ncbi:hypothetical protein [Rhodococcus sp. NPDC003348]
MEPKRAGYERLLRNSKTVPNHRTASSTVAVRGEELPERHADELLTFARRWLPYGGAPADEIFEQFGMTTRRFLEALWISIRNSGAGTSDQRTLAAVYPKPQRASVRS